MNRMTLWASALAVVALCAGKAVAGEPAAPEGTKADASTRAVTAKPAKDAQLSADMAATLRKAGFTDLQIMPNAILVRAKNKDGKPVAMVLHPGSMTEVVTLDPHSGSAAAGNGSPPLIGSGTFATLLPTQRLASTLIGLKVRDSSKAEIGTIKDIAIDHDGVHAYVVGIGGVLGVGGRHVAVAPNAIDITYDKATNTYGATMNATLDQLKAAPDVAYKGALSAGRD